MNAKKWSDDPPYYKEVLIQTPPELRPRKSLLKILIRLLKARLKVLLKVQLRVLISRLPYKLLVKPL